MNTLAVFTGGIGDTLLAGPAFALLHEQGPLDLAGNPDRLALIKAAGACNAVYDLDHIGFHTIFNQPNAKISHFLCNYDRVVVWMRDDGAIDRALTECGVERVDVYPGLPPEDWTRHASAYYVECVGDAARREPRPPIRIAFREGEAPAEPQHDVVIHPGSGSAKKNWSMEHFEAVADRLENEGRRVSWVRGPAEEGLTLPPGARLLEADTLLDLAEQLATARLYIGNDSGITHLAATTGCPTTAIFGPTDPTVWAPLGNHVCVVANGSRWPTIGDVLGAAKTAPDFA